MGVIASCKCTKESEITEINLKLESEIDHKSGEMMKELSLNDMTSKTNPKKFNLSV